MNRASLKRKGKGQDGKEKLPVAESRKRTGDRGKAGKKDRQEKLEFVQDFIPVRDIRNGIIETTDGRYIRILEIEPVNFMLRSAEEQYGIISSFASWLKISPMRLQFKSITRKADSGRHIAMLREEMADEDSPECRELAEGYVRLVKDVGSREALTRRFFLIFQYEEARRGDGDDYSRVLGMIGSAEQNARAYFMQCGNSIIQNRDEDEAAAEMLYMFFNRRSCVTEPFQSRVRRVVVDMMAARGRVIGVDPVPKIRTVHFLAPRGIDLTHPGYVIMDGMYFCFLYIKGNGYPGQVRGGWMSALVNAGEGIDVDVFLQRENRSRSIDKVAQRIRLNRTKLRGMQDTSTDYEELTSSIQAGYYMDRIGPRSHYPATYPSQIFFLKENGADPGDDVRGQEAGAVSGAATDAGNRSPGKGTKSRTDIPRKTLVLFGAGMAAAVGGLIALHFVQKRESGPEEYDDEDEYDDLEE